MPIMQFRRGRIYQVLALLAFVLAGFALFSPLLSAFTEDTSLRNPSLAGAIGLLAAIALLRALCMSTVTVHYIVMVPVIGLTLGVASELLVPELIPPTSIVTTFVAGWVFFYEQGLMVEISETGFLRSSRFPLQRQVRINWNEIETVTADLRRITTHLTGESYGITDQKNRLVIRGQGKKISLGTPPYRLAAGGEPNAHWITGVHPRMASAAIDWTVKQIRLHGSVKLGPIEIANDSVTISRRAGSRKQIRFVELHQVALQAGDVLFTADHTTTSVPLHAVPNGLYLPEILRAAGWRGEATAAS
jgi:hypothetical protein